MNNEDVQLIKELMYDLTVPQSKRQIGYSEPQNKVNHLKKLIESGILNPNRYQLKNNHVYMQVHKDKKIYIEENDGSFENVEFIWINHDETNILTPEGNRIYSTYVDQNCYRRLKNKAWVEILIDLAAIIGFVISIILGFMKIFNC